MLEKSTKQKKVILTKGHGKNTEKNCTNICKLTNCLSIYANTVIGTSKNKVKYPFNTEARAKITQVNSDLHCTGMALAETHR